ncbi:ACT domain-containing protein [Ruminiclostridium cellulolyticum]|uniref:Amino acid-binding ACT domain protein n=1 Tax=Ruminiclostridium cellulolyticum (strain ATCC 35319 / DSM 5812 / JCM 6584 / H10) TaxID=394503 RepID=B8I7C6_RUMCH|nr:ACT domain-containing protein [Ruminiclostridium cellulolyticum]ACL75050.1 amino acid-binding ACT domain protein [Ruminiclostridium cellulolyticum H10]
MLVKQISVFLENKSGRLADVTRTLADNNINICAMSIADTTDFGILRLIVNKPEEAESALSEQQFTVSCTSVIAIGVEDKPGGLAKALDILRDNGISIEYMYAFVGKTGNEAFVILRVENPETAIETLLKYGIEILPNDKIYCA